MFFHMTHIGSPCMRAADTRRPRRQEASDAKAGSCREQKAAAGGERHPRGKRPPQPLPASMRSGPAAPSDKRARPSYPDYDRRRVEDFAARTRWMPSAVARYSFASCPLLSPNTGVHTTHNARGIFGAIVWRYARSALLFKVRPSLQTTAFEPNTPPSTLGYPFADFTPALSRQNVSSLFNDAPGQRF